MPYLDEKTSKMDLPEIMQLQTKQEMNKTPPLLVLAVARHEMGDVEGILNYSSVRKVCQLLLLCTSNLQEEGETSKF